MPKPQFSTRQDWRTCPECFGRSFSDPLKEFHWKDCSRYREWRFGKKKVGVGSKDPRRGASAGDVLDTAASPAPTTQRLIEDKVMDSVLEDMEERSYQNYSDREESFNEQWREVHGEVPW